jgi:hypothetical protein
MEDEMPPTIVRPKSASTHGQTDHVHPQSEATVPGDAGRPPRPSLQELIDFERTWSDQNRALLDSLPRGTAVAVNMTTGDYVTAPNGLKAMDLFEERFGTSVWAWVHEVGVPITIGGGLWALSSGA